MTTTKKVAILILLAHIVSTLFGMFVFMIPLMVDRISEYWVLIFWAPALFIYENLNTVLSKFILVMMNHTSNPVTTKRQDIPNLKEEGEE